MAMKMSTFGTFEDDYRVMLGELPAPVKQADPGDETGRQAPQADPVRYECRCGNADCPDNVRPVEPAEQSTSQVDAVTVAMEECHRIWVELGRPIPCHDDRYLAARGRYAAAMGVELPCPGCDNEACRRHGCQGGPAKPTSHITTDVEMQAYEQRSRIAALFGCACGNAMCGSEGCARAAAAINLGKEKS